MTVALVGAGGFIGLHFSEYARSQKLDLDLYSRPESHSFLQGQFPSTDIMSSVGNDFWENAPRYCSVVYLNSSFRSTSEEAVSTEVMRSVRDAAHFFERLSRRNRGCRVIFASSGGTVYGPGHSDPISETAATNPATPYGLSKSLIEQTLKFIATSYGMPVTVLRIANPVGYWQLRGRHGFVSAAIRCALAGELLTVYGDGSNARDYFDVDDLAALMLRLAVTPFRGFRLNNVGSGIETSELEVIRAVEGALSTKINVVFSAKRQTDIRYAVLNPDRTNTELGWRSNEPLSSLISKISNRIEQHGLPERTFGET